MNDNHTKIIEKKRECFVLHVKILIYLAKKKKKIKIGYEFNLYFNIISKYILYNC